MIPKAVTPAQATVDAMLVESKWSDQYLDAYEEAARHFRICRHLTLVAYQIALEVSEEASR